MAIGTTVFSRVTVVAPRTRIDVALPADVSVADLLPMLLEMAREATPDGGARHGGWALGKLGGGQLDPSRTLASLGVVDGDLLQLRKRSDNPPPPLYDDVVDAIAEATPDSYRPWTRETARRAGHLIGGAAFVLAAVAVLFAGPIGGGQNLGPAIAAGVVAIACIALGATLARSYETADTGVLIAGAGGVPMAFVAGLYIVPDFTTSPNLLLGCGLALIVSAAAIGLIGEGITTFVATGTTGFIGAVAFAITSVFEDVTIPAVAAGTASVALAGISLLPRLTIQLAKLPLPNVPGSAEDLKEDAGFQDYSQIERRAGLAHQYMTGMIIGAGFTSAVGAVLSAAAPTIFGPIFAAVVAAVLLLRGRTYANGSQAIALLATGTVAGLGIAIAWIQGADPLSRLLWVFGALVILAVGALVCGVVLPNQRFSPVMRRTVEIIEAILIAAVLPLALAVMNLYSVVRHLDLGS